MGDAFNAVDGVRISFQEQGAGPTIVLVHGSGLSRAIWRGLGYTKAFAGALSRGDSGSAGTRPQ